MSVSLLPSVELEVAHRPEFLLGRGRAEAEGAQFRRTLSMNLTVCPSRRIVHIPALQQIIFNADRCAFESMIRDQGKANKVSFSSQVLTSFLHKYVPQLLGQGAVDGLCCHPPGDANGSFGSPEVELDRAKVQKLPACRTAHPS